MSFFHNATVLVTGGTGSFGKVVVSHLLSKNCKEIRILSRDELKQHEMRATVHDNRVKFFIGDVRDENSVNAVMQGVDYVFQAAALKQVPSCEFFPLQAVFTNIIGSNNVIKSAIDHGVKRVVCLSTDKAVYPINAMGMSKALMEKVAQSFSRSFSEIETIVNVVRYGNVMYSRGSVIPLFVNQLKSGQPLTITEPNMTRFLMALSEAVDLVEYAFQNGKQGDLFIRKAPAATIEVLAQALKNIFNIDTKISIIGIRHGEKIYETLASKEELIRSEDLGNYFRIKLDDRNLNYDLYFSEGENQNTFQDEYNSHNTKRLTVKETEDILLSLPEIQKEIKLLS